MIDAKLKEIKNIYDKIMAREKIDFNSLTPKSLGSQSVVYVIFHKSTDQILYVGQTKDLHDRLYKHHLNGNEGSTSFKRNLIKDCVATNRSDSREWIKANCYFKYMEVGTTVSERLHVERALSFLFEPKYTDSKLKPVG